MFQILQGAQMLFVAFGALVLVPLLTGLDPSVALFGAGIGTLIFQVLTKRSVPIFLASSFAFIAPIMYGIQAWGVPSMLGGLMMAGAVYVVLGVVIRVRAILNSQASRQDRLSFADDVINNDSPLTQEIKQALLLEVTQLHQKYMSLC